jgi:hypothetical protein
MILGSSVVTASFKGLFVILKKHFELEKAKLKQQSEIEIAQLKTGKIKLMVAVMASLW